jgi:hypothetical protein
MLIPAYSRSDAWNLFEFKLQSLKITVNWLTVFIQLIFP